MLNKLNEDEAKLEDFSPFAKAEIILQKKIK